MIDALDGSKIRQDSSKALSSPLAFTMTVPNATPNREPISLAPLNPDDGIEEESHIFATLRYDPILIKSPQNTAASFNRPCPFYLLEHQWTRLQVANWSTSFYRKPGESQIGYGGPSNFWHGLLQAVYHWLELHLDERGEPLRIKIRSYVGGRVTTDIRPSFHVPLSSLFVSSLGVPDQLEKTVWTVVLDIEPTEATESTMYKTSDRSPYGRARANAGIMELYAPKEVLMYNPAGEILDGSQSTPYFYRDGRWVTPTSSCGGLQGTTRRWALENGHCIEGTVSKDSVTPGEMVWLSNAVKGFFTATVVDREDGMAGDDTSKQEQQQYIEQQLANGIVPSHSDRWTRLRSAGA